MWRLVKLKCTLYNHHGSSVLSSKALWTLLQGMEGHRLQLWRMLCRMHGNASLLPLLHIFFSEVLCIFGMRVLSLVMWLGSWRTILSAKPWEKTVGRLQGIVQSESPDGICGRSESQWCRLCLTLPPWGIPTGYKCGGVEDGWEVPRIAMVSCKPHVWGNCRVLGGTSFPSCRSSDDDGEEESAAQGSRQTHDNLYRVHMPSLYSCGSSYGSETSIPAAAHTVSNAPVTEYMWVSWQKGWIPSPASCCAQML